MLGHGRHNSARFTGSTGEPEHSPAGNFIRPRSGPWPPEHALHRHDNTNLPGIGRFARARHRENGLFSHYAYYVANAQPLPGYPRGGKPVIIITRSGIAILCFIFGSQSSGIVVTRSTVTIKYAKVEFE